MDTKDTPLIDFRLANNEDVIAITLLRREFMSNQIEQGLLDIPEKVEDAVSKQTPMMMNNKRNVFFVASSADKILAYIYGTTKIVPGMIKSRIFSIEEMYVLPDFNGKKIGQTLFNSFLAHIKESSPDRIQLRVLEKNNRGKRFWKSLGFTENVTVMELQ